MMIHQQPPPKPPLLPQHMICHLTFDIPVTETGLGAAERRRRGRPPFGHRDRLGRRGFRGAGAVPRAVLPFVGHTMWRLENGFLPPARSSQPFRPPLAGQPIICKE